MALRAVLMTDVVRSAGRGESFARDLMIYGRAVYESRVHLIERPIMYVCDLLLFLEDEYRMGVG